MIREAVGLPGNHYKGIGGAAQHTKHVTRVMLQTCWFRVLGLGLYGLGYLLVVVRESGNTSYRVYIGMIFPYSLLTTRKVT